jgi:hypothetical protein
MHHEMLNTAIGSEAAANWKRRIVLSRAKQHEYTLPMCVGLRDASEKLPRDHEIGSAYASNGSE